MRCDRARILQVFANLIGNAVKFTPAAGSIMVRGKRRDDALWFSVVDTGPGISREDQLRIFDKFWQAKATARLVTGLGLAIAKGIVEAHGGTIWTESELGAGTAFWFSVPLAGPPGRGVASGRGS